GHRHSVLRGHVRSSKQDVHVFQRNGNDARNENARSGGAKDDRQRSHDDGVVRNPWRSGKENDGNRLHPRRQEIAGGRARPPGAPTLTREAAVSVRRSSGRATTLLWRHTFGMQRTARPTDGDFFDLRGRDTKKLWCSLSSVTDNCSQRFSQMKERTCFLRCP